MYDDYPTIYETSLNQNFIYFIILGIVALILIIISLLALAKIFKKANRSGISAFIPIYNIMTLLEITNSPKIYLLLFLIPGVNIVVNVFVMLSLAKFFRKSDAFAFGLAFLPFIFYPILAFSNSEYIGINLTAMEGKSIVVDIPKVTEQEENKTVVHEEKDTALENINISIGGGVYQKDYTNTLLEVDEKQAIKNNNLNSITDSSLRNNHLNKSTFIKPIEEKEEIPMEEATSMNINFPNQINQTPVEEIEVELVSHNIESPSTNNIMRNPLENVLEPINNIPKIENQSSSVMSREIPTVPDSQLLENSEYISCPKCGAKIKSEAKVCFLCGRRLDQI